MIFQSHTVRGVLTELVDWIVFMSGREMGTGVAFPRMNQAMIINLGSPFHTRDVYRVEASARGGVNGVWMNGKQDEPFQLENDGVTSMFAIGLKLGMVPYFAGMPAMEGNNLAVPAEDWGTGARMRSSEIALLRERLLECSVDDGFVLIERYLLSLVAGGDLSGLRRVQWLGRALYTRSVEELCRELGVTRKRLRSDAQYYFGDSVKNIQGIIRLNRTLAKIALATIGEGASGAGALERPGGEIGADGIGAGSRRKGAGGSLSSLHEYFDQSHFIRDFKARTGITPLQYRRLCREFPLIGRTPNFLPMSRETFLQFISGEAG